MTMRYTHIGLDDQAKAIQNLPTAEGPAAEGPAAEGPAADDEDAWECAEWP